MGKWSQVGWFISRMEYEMVIWFMLTVKKMTVSGDKCPAPLWSLVLPLSFQFHWAILCTSKKSLSELNYPKSVYIFCKKKSQFHGTWMNEGNRVLKKSTGSRDKALALLLVPLQTAAVYLFLSCFIFRMRLSPGEDICKFLRWILKTIHIHSPCKFCQKSLPCQHRSHALPYRWQLKSTEPPFLIELYSNPQRCWMENTLLD